MSDVRTVTVLYNGGSQSEVDVPREGTPARELFDSLVADGTYTVLDDYEPETPTVADEVSEPADPTAVPDGTIGEVVAWVRGADEDNEPADGWHERARQALEHELAKGDDARSRLVKLLNEVAG